MSQVSLPVRILLIGAVVFLAAWFTVLRPKSDTVDTATTTTTAPAVATATATAAPQTALGRAVAKARAVADAAKPGATATPAAATATAPAAATTSVDTTPVAIPAAALAKLPGSVATALQARKTLVLGVIADQAKAWRPLSDDDRYVRNTLRKVNTYDGQVLVKTVPVAKLSTYAPLVGDLDVSETPSVVVIDNQLKGTVLTGYVDRVAVNQAIMDARRTSLKPYISDPYLTKANAICAKTSTALDRWSLPTIRGKKAAKAADSRRRALWKGYRAAVARTATPKQHRALKALWLSEIDATIKGAKSQHKLFVKLDRAFDKAGLTSCSVLRPS